MKKLFVLIAAFAIVFTCANMIYVQRSQFMTKLLLKNVEALASENESSESLYVCEGTGCVDCPDGRKAETVIKFYKRK